MFWKSNIAEGVKAEMSSEENGGEWGEAGRLTILTNMVLRKWVP